MRFFYLWNSAALWKRQRRQGPGQFLLRIFEDFRRPWDWAFGSFQALENFQALPIRKLCAQYFGREYCLALFYNGLRRIPGNRVRILKPRGKYLLQFVSGDYCSTHMCMAFLTRVKNIKT